MSPAKQVAEKRQAILSHFDLADPIEQATAWHRLLTRHALLQLFIEEYMLDAKFQAWAIAKQKQDQFKVVNNG